MNAATTIFIIKDDKAFWKDSKGGWVHIRLTDPDKYLESLVVDTWNRATELGFMIYDLQSIINQMYKQGISIEDRFTVFDKAQRTPLMNQIIAESQELRSLASRWAKQTKEFEELSERMRKLISALSLSEVKGFKFPEGRW